MLYTLLRHAGCDVSSAGGVADAKRAISGERFDLTILDNRLPDGSGIDLCRWVREQAPDTPVVFYSGAALERDRDEGMRAGAAAYVTKPEIKGLVTAVNALLRDAGCEVAVAY
jgi:DNA-binding response OmpR family regulator